MIHVPQNAVCNYRRNEEEKGKIGMHSQLLRAGDILHAGRGRARVEVLYPDAVRVTVWSAGGTESRYEGWSLKRWPEEWRHENDTSVDVEATIASMKGLELMGYVAGVVEPVAFPRVQLPTVSNSPIRNEGETKP